MIGLICCVVRLVDGAMVQCDQKATHRRKNDGALACAHHRALMSEVHHACGRPAADDVWDKIALDWKPWKPSALSAGVCSCGATPTFIYERFGLLRCEACLSRPLNAEELGRAFGPIVVTGKRRP